MRKMVLVLFIQLGAAGAVACFKNGATVLSAMCLVATIGLLIDYAKAREE